MDRIEAVIARTLNNPNLRIELLTLESQSCRQARSVITYEISAERREHDIRVSRTQASMKPWKDRGSILEKLAQKHADAMAKLHEEDYDFGEAKKFADDQIRKTRRTRN